jgi:hypothetical protein
VCLILFSILGRDWRELIGILSAATLWIVSFVAVYVLSLNDAAQNEILQRYWDKAFIPFPPVSALEVKWYLEKLFAVFENPGGFFFVGLAALAFAIGLLSMYRRKKECALILLAPILVTLVASALRKYPFQGRLLLFMAPIIVLFAAEGLEQIRESTKSNFRFIGRAAIFLLFLHPVATSGYHFLKPVETEEIKPVIQYIELNRKSDDSVYLYHASAPAYRYYSWYWNFKKDARLIEGINAGQDWGKYLKDLERLRGKGRVWFVFTPTGMDEQKFFYTYLDALGTKVDSFMAHGAAAFLYSL